MLEQPREEMPLQPEQLQQSMEAIGYSFGIQEVTDEQGFQRVIYQTKDTEQTTTFSFRGTYELPTFSPDTTAAVKEIGSPPAPGILDKQ